MFKLFSWKNVSLIENQVGLILLIFLIFVGSFLSPVFLTPYNLYSILWAVSVLGIVCLGQAILLITANFDMSVSMVVPFTGIVTVGAQMSNFGLWPSIMIGLLVATLIGFINGFIVVITKANAFLITFGMQTLVYAIALIPAKTDSTRLSKKNLQIINGKTLVEHTIDYALKSEYIKDIIVSKPSKLFNSSEI